MATKAINESITTKPISELPQALNVNNQDLFVLEQSGIAKKLTAETFITEQGIIDALAAALDGHGGIASVTLASVSGRIRTYLITFTDNTTTTFQVLDGSTITSIQKTSSIGLIDEYTIYMSDGSSSTFQVRNGQDGAPAKDGAPAITETATGVIANFPDGADDIPVTSLVADIDPVQDLTYGDPYPAGGGANKLGILVDVNSTVNNVDVSYSTETEEFSVSGKNSNSSAHIVFSFNASSLSLPTFTAGDTYTIFCDNTSLSMYMQFVYKDSNNSNHPLGYCHFSYGKISFTIPNDYVTFYQFQIYLASNVTTINGTFHIWLEEGTVSTSSFTPYSNICPITGHTEVNVTRTGKNLLSNSVTSTTTNNVTFTVNADRSITVSTSGTASARANLFYSGKLYLQASTYYFSIGKAFNIGQCYFEIQIHRAATDTNQYMNTNGRSGFAFTLSDGDYINQMYFSVFNGQAVNDTIYPQIEVGSSATTYEPYQGTSLTVDWTTEAGTVYGGTIDVTTGLLTVTHQIFQVPTTAIWEANNNARYTSLSALGLTPSNMKNPPAGTANRTLTRTNWCKTNALKPTANGWSATASSSVAQFVISYDDYIMLNIGITHPTSAQINQFIADVGLQLYYPLATPQTYQLTPQEVKTLLGTNNVWADTGDTSVTYTADTKLYIEKLTMPTEDDMVANQAITSGKYFMIGNSLYLALANIASGAQITIGTNAQRVSLADALNAINS